MSNTIAMQKNFSVRYALLDLKRNLLIVSATFFAIALPVCMYLIFGTMADYSEIELANGSGNVGAAVMVGMATYGALTAAVGLTASAAVELHTGWGRQLAVTPLSHTGYVLNKIVVTIIFSALPVVAVLAAGALSGARMQWYLWLTIPGLILVCAVMFSLYGLAFGLLFRSETANNAAGGLLVLFMFMGNGFAPLSGVLLELSVFTPAWGVLQLTKWPLMEGTTFDIGSDALVQYEMWQVAANIGVWTLIFAALCFVGARRHTGRK